METREIFKEKARKTIDFIFDSIASLEQRSHHMTDDLKTKMAPHLETLKAKKDELEHEFHRVKHATAESWEDAKLGFEISADIMHRQIEKMREHYKKHEKETA